MTDFWVNPTSLGSGDGTSAGSAATFATIWAIIDPVKASGPTINVLGTDPATDGKYNNANSTIEPPVGMAGGSPSTPIVIKAVNDGGVWIYGNNTRACCRLGNSNNYFTIQGIDFSNNGPGMGATIDISGNYITFQRCVAWDAPSTRNVHVWSINGNSGFDPLHAQNILIEDCAGFGCGRKSFENYGNIGPNVLRRFWGRWERSEVSGPKRVIQDAYSSKNLTIDNAIIRVNDILPNPYTFLDDDGTPKVYPTETSCGGGNPNNPVAGQCQYPGTTPTSDLIVSGTGWAGETQYNVASDGANVNCNSMMCGVLTFQLSGEPISMTYGTTRGMWEHKLYGNATIRDAFVYVAPGVVDRYRGDTTAFRGFSLAAGADDGAGHVALQCALTNATSIAPNSDVANINAKWTQTNKITATTLSGALGSGSLYGGASGRGDGLTGASIRYRYKNGVLTGEELWPWPMSARIKAATTRASTDGHGHTIEDVDAIVQSTFGAFPVSSPNGVWFTS